MDPAAQHPGAYPTYELHPYHLLAYRGNWYVLARNVEKKRMATFAFVLNPRFFAPRIR